MAIIQIIAGCALMLAGLYLGRDAIIDIRRSHKEMTYKQKLDVNVNKKYPPLSESEVSQIAAGLSQEELKVLFFYIDRENRKDDKKHYIHIKPDYFRSAESSLHTKQLIFSWDWLPAIDQKTDIATDRNGVTPWGWQVSKRFAIS